MLDCKGRRIKEEKFENRRTFSSKGTDAQCFVVLPQRSICSSSADCNSHTDFALRWRWPGRERTTGDTSGLVGDRGVCGFINYAAVDREAL